MPAGFTADGLPVGVELLGRAFEDGKLVGYAYAYEQATHHRRAPARTPALRGETNVAAISWEARAGAVSGKFSFDPTTNELSWRLTAAAVGDGDVLSASIHRAARGENGPAIAVLANRGFQSIAGSETLTDPDRERLMGGGLYLRVGLRSGEVRIVLQAMK
jgi:hypothetical protein